MDDSIGPAVKEIPLAGGRWSSPPDMPIPNRLNLTLVAVVFLLAHALLWLAIGLAADKSL